MVLRRSWFPGCNSTSPGVTGSEVLLYLVYPQCLGECEFVPLLAAVPRLSVRVQIWKRTHLVRGGVWLALDMLVSFQNGQPIYFLPTVRMGKISQTLPLDEELQVVDG